MEYQRRFGIEIEFKGNRSLVAQAIREQGIDCVEEGYNHHTRSHWKIVTDASLGYDNAGEVVSPILQGEDGVEQLRSVCRALELADARVDRQCGLHIHLDARDMSVAEIQTVFKRYSDYEQQIDQIMPPSRRGSNRWCGSIANATSIKERQYDNKNMLADALGRYFKVNLTNIASRGSIEFRQHSGTTSFEKMYNWLSFLQQFVLSSIQLTGIARTTRRQRSKQRWYNKLRDAFEDNGGSVVYSKSQKAWRFEQNGRSFFLNNLQIASLYSEDSPMKNHDLNSDWKLHINAMGGFAPRTQTSSTPEQDSFTFGLTQTTVDWLARRANEVA